MDGDGQALAAKSAPQWADAAALHVDIYALEHPDEDPVRTAAAVKRVTIALRVAATQGCTRVAPLFPAIGRQRAEKATPKQKHRTALYKELIRRIDPEGKLKKTKIYEAIEERFKYYAKDTWPHQLELNHQPPNGENSHDDILWQFFKSGHKTPVSLQTIYNLTKKPKPRSSKSLRN